VDHRRHRGEDDARLRKLERKPGLRIKID